MRACRHALRQCDFDCSKRFVVPLPLDDLWGFIGWAPRLGPGSFTPPLFGFDLSTFRVAFGMFDPNKWLRLSRKMHTTGARGVGTLSRRVESSDTGHANY